MLAISWCLPEQALSAQAGHTVVGSYMSPVNDAYKKPELLPSQHRIAMCHMAAAESDLIMVDTWEAGQPDAQRSLAVLQRVQQAVEEHYRSLVSMLVQATACIACHTLCHSRAQSCIMLQHFSCSCPILLRFVSHTFAGACLLRACKAASMQGCTALCMKMA